MLLSRKSRDRTVGLMAAYVVLIAGIVWSGSMESAPAKGGMQATEATVDRAKTKLADDCASTLECRSGTYC